MPGCSGDSCALLQEGFSTKYEMFLKARVMGLQVAGNAAPSADFYINTRARLQRVVYIPKCDVKGGATSPGGGLRLHGL